MAAVLCALPAAAGEKPKYGGTLTYMIPADAPASFDGHRDTYYATVHSVAPFYSVLIHVNPENPSSTTDFVCDLCAEMPQPSDDGKTYTFKIRQDVQFHDGSPLTAADVAASWNRIIFAPEGTAGGRAGYDLLVDKVEAPDPRTVVFQLKFATTAFLPALADPAAFIYKKDILDKDSRWYESHILGSGAFKFAGYETGQSIKGVRNPDYYHRDLPYLDSFTGIYAGKQAVRVEAIRSNRAAIEFRSLPPAARDELVKVLGANITVQESDLNIVSLVTPNHRKTPFDDPRVRRALTLAIDRWRGAPALSTIAIVHTVGSLVFPGSPLAPTREELEEIAGFWPDIEKSRAEARRLLKEAGADGLSFELLNSNVDQPYKYVATWLIDEWSKIGLHVTQRVIPTGPWVEAMRKDRSACPTTISRRQQPHSADGTLSLDLGRQNPDPSARRHGAHGTHANQNHRPRYPFKPAVPSESGQVAQNLALNPHRPTLPPAHTPPAVSSFEAFRTPASMQPLAQ